MGLFGKKPIYRYKMFEKYKINIEQTNASFVSSNIKLNDYDVKEYCKKIGETSKYNIYVYQQQVNGMGGYLLRQEKAAPRKVVFMGQAKNKICVYQEKVFMIDRISRVGQTYHPLFCIDVENGNKTELDILSHKECYIVRSSFHIHSQDFVESITVDDGLMIMEVSRYKEKIDYEKDFTYHIQIRYVSGNFVPQYFYPFSE